MRVCAREGEKEEKWERMQRKNKSIPSTSCTAQANKSHSMKTEEVEVRICGADDMRNKKSAKEKESKTDESGGVERVRERARTKHARQLNGSRVDKTQ